MQVTSYTPQFNKRITVAKIKTMAELIQAYEYLDDVMLHVHRTIRMADMMPDCWYDGYEAVYDAMERQFKQAAGTNKHKVPELNVVSDENIGMIQIQVEIDQINDGDHLKFTFREFDIVQKRGSQWMVMQTSVYVPIDPETGVKTTNAVTPRGPLEWSSDPIPGPAVSDEQAEQEIEAWFRSRIAAKDAETLLGHFGPGDDTVVYAQVLPDEHRGLEEIRAHFTAQLAGVKSIEAEPTDLRILTNGLLGGVHARINFTITREDGAVERFSKRHANLLRRVGDR